MTEMLVVMALREESQGEFERAGVPVLFTGVGKVNAAHALTRRLAELRAGGRAMPHVIHPLIALGILADLSRGDAAEAALRRHAGRRRRRHPRGAAGGGTPNCLFKHFWLPALG